MRYTRVGKTNGSFIISESGIVVVLANTACVRINVLCHEPGLAYGYDIYRPRVPTDSQVRCARMACKSNLLSYFSQSELHRSLLAWNPL